MGILYLVTSHYTGKKQVYEILIVQSYDSDCSWKDELNKGVKDAFNAHLLQANTRTFYLDCEGLLAQAEIDTLTLLLNEYKEKAPDLIITCDDAATYSLIQTQHPYTYQVPIVFCGVDYVNKKILPGHTNITGFSTRPDFIQCYQLAKQLFGNISQITVLIEDGYLGRVYKEDIYRQYKKVPEISVAEETTKDSIIYQTLTPTPLFEKDTIKLLVKRVDKMAGQQLKWNLYHQPHSFSIIPKWNPLYTQFPAMGTIPFLTVNNEGFGEGQIGGYMTPSYKQTYEAAERGIKILLGAPPASFPMVTFSKKVPVFDWEMLNYWQIDRKRLPTGSIILHMPFTERYHNVLLAGSIAGGIIIFSIILFLGHLYKKEQKHKKSIQKRLEKEQKELSITMESISEGVLSINPEFQIFNINMAALKWLQLDKPADTYLGNKIRELFNIISRDNPHYLKELLEQVSSSQSGISFGEEVFLVSPENKTFPVSGSINNIYNEKILGGYVITFRDITDEYTQKGMLALSMLGGNLFAWHYDEPTQRFIFDEAFFKTLQIPNNPTYSITYDEFIRIIHPEDLPRWHKGLQLIESGRITKINLQLRLNINGKGFEWWEYRIASLFKSSLEQHYRLFGICLNIQHFKTTQEELIRFRDEAIESDRLKGIFMANMSHEIRTPLNAIVGFSTLLTESKSYDLEERKVFIETINENCQLLLNLINEILDISRIESGIQFHKEKCNLNSLIEEVAEAFRPSIRRDVSIITQLPDTPLYMETDILRLKQIFNNLMGNAVKFTHVGHIILGYSFIPDKYCVSLFVEDSGIGISQEEQIRIFERFYKTNDFIQGGGLGLSICKEIVKRMNGTIRVESEINKGTRFIIDIPL